MVLGEMDECPELSSRPHADLSRLSGTRKFQLPGSTVNMLAGREVNSNGRGRFSSADYCRVLSRYLPVNGPWHIDHFSSRAYVSQFSSDGSHFVAASQGTIRIYDVEDKWKVRKNIQAENMRWIVTDTSLSPDRRFLVYASMTPVVHIVDTASATRESIANVTEIHDGLNFSVNDEEADSFAIFSVKFSTDGRELVAGSNDHAIYVYDLEANRLTLRIPAHLSDVNTVCFADETGHIIYSGSDDDLCKVWDKRCFNATGRPEGVLMGHLEGVTFIDSRGDGLYFISNGKDQTIKLWDIRKMSSGASSSTRNKTYKWDYRSTNYPSRARDIKHPSDQSVASYKGHSVLRTLVRCYFSPAFSTGQKYIYTGSQDCCVYIYDLVSGDQVGRLEHHTSIVRDCNWHPYYPMLVSSSWDGFIARWEFSGNGEKPARKRSKLLADVKRFFLE